MDRLSPDFGRTQEESNRRDEVIPAVPRVPIDTLLARQAELSARSTQESIPPKVGVEALGTVLTRRSAEQFEERSNTESAPVTNSAESAIPRLVMEQAAAAAEQNIPIEKAYELRSEVRDDTTTGVGASQSGAKAGGANMQHQKLAQDYAPKMPIRQRGLLAYIAAMPVHYRQSVALGFVIALILAFTLGIVYLLTS